jgi:hypothetical protein
MARGTRGTRADRLNGCWSTSPNVWARFAAAFLRRRPVRVSCPSHGAEWSPRLHLRSRPPPPRDARSALQRRSIRRSGNRHPTAAGWARTHDSRADEMKGLTKFDLRVSRRSPFPLISGFRRDTSIEKARIAWVTGTSQFFTQHY